MTINLSSEDENSLRDAVMVIMEEIGAVENNRQATDETFRISVARHMTTTNN